VNDLPLILKIENVDTLPDGGPLTMELNCRGIDIGRDSYLDWTLPDPERFISGKHCEVRYRDGGYWLHDVSTNGTTVNEDSGRLTEPYRIKDGDRIHIGRYIIAARLAGEDGATGQKASAGASASNADPWGDIAGAAESVSRRDFQTHSTPPRQSASGRPVLGDVAEEEFSWSVGETQSRGDPTADDLDIDWATPSPAKREPAPAIPYAPPPDEADELELGPAEEVAHELTPAPAERTPLPASSQEPERRRGLAEQWSGGETPVPAPPPQRPAAEPVAAPSSAAAAAGDWVAAFERGAGLPAGSVSQAKGGDALAEELGRLFHMVAGNLKAMLAARDETKNAMRSSQRTMIQAMENNPLKFSPSAEDALRIMFGEKTRSYLDAGQTLEASFGDLKSHQMQTFTAMQQALQALIEDLDPDKIAEGTASDSGLAGIVSSRRAKLWDTYVERFKAKASRHERGMIDAFMILFAEMYDRQGRR